MRPVLHKYLDGIEIKLCSKCKIWKNVLLFGKQADKLDGLRCWCKECHNTHNRLWFKDWLQNNRERRSHSHKQWRMKNPDSVKKTLKKAQIKTESDPKRKMSRRISSYISKCLKKGKQGKHWEDIVGYTLDELVRHLERKFKPGMSWNNYGEWHIDHIIPLSKFNFSTLNSIDFKRAWDLKNLQPLWARDNQTKQNSLDKPFQPALGF